MGFNKIKQQPEVQGFIIEKETNFLNVHNKSLYNKSVPIAPWRNDLSKQIELEKEKIDLCKYNPNV